MDAFPTLERARATLKVRKAPAWQFWNRSNLLRDEPIRSDKLAALWLDARLLIRETRHSEEHVGPRTFERLPRAEGEPSTGGRSQYIGRVIDPAPTTCSFCSMAPGRCPCSACGGEGLIATTQTDAQGNSRTVMIPCGGCSASGFVECGCCDGTAKSQRVEIAWVEDDWKTLRYVYPPPLNFALESELRSYMEGVDAWPDTLSMPLKEQLVSGPYRSGPSSIEEFQGYIVDGAIDSARAMVDRIRGTGRVLSAEVRAFVIPLLYLRYQERKVVVHHRVDGGMGVLVSP